MDGRVKGFVAITDTDWFEFLSELNPPDEVLIPYNRGY